jgi:hypothetical protein
MVSYLRPWLEKAKGRRFIAGQIRDNKKEITPACFSAYLQRRARPRGSRVGRGQSVHLFGLGPLAMTQLHISRKRFWRGGRRRFGSFLAKIGLRKRSSSLYKPRSQPKPNPRPPEARSRQGQGQTPRQSNLTIRLGWRSAVFRLFRELRPAGGGLFGQCGHRSQSLSGCYAPLLYPFDKPDTPR